jgi:hypothetical protein
LAHELRRIDVLNNRCCAASCGVCFDKYVKDAADESERYAYVVQCDVARLFLPEAESILVKFI